MTAGSTNLSAEDALASYFATHDVNRNIFRADLSAARYVLRMRRSSDGPSVTRFSVYHGDVTAEITGRRVDLLRMCSEERLADILRRWATLYAVTLEDLQARHPPSESAHLEFDGVDWTELLGISAVGLRTIDQASRYAEYWAQQAVSDDGAYHSFSSRLRYVTSAAYREMAALKEGGDMLVFGSDRLGTPSYDVAQVARRRPPSVSVRDWLVYAGHFPTVLRERAELHLESLSEHPPQQRRRYRVEVVRAGTLRAFVQCSLPWHALAAHFTCLRPDDPAWVAFDDSGAVAGCVVSGRLAGSAPPPTRCLVTRDQGCSWDLLDVLRRTAPFQRLYFDVPAAAIVGAVFPNQPTRQIWSLGFEDRSVPLSEAGSIQMSGSPNQGEPPFVLGRSSGDGHRAELELVSAGVVVAKCRLVYGGNTAVATAVARSGNAAATVELLRKVGNAARLSGVVVQVLVEATNAEFLALAEKSGYRRSHRVLALDEWYFVDGARSLRRAAIPRGANAGVPAGLLAFVDNFESAVANDSPAPSAVAANS
jgi:hypothetical protein